MKSLVDCGCEVKLHADRSGIEIYFCQLHGSVERLQAENVALKIEMANGKVLVAELYASSWRDAEEIARLKSENATLLRESDGRDELYAEVANLKSENGKLQATLNHRQFVLDGIIKSYDLGAKEYAKLQAVNAELIAALNGVVND